MVAVAEAEDTSETMDTVAELGRAFSSEVIVFHARERILHPHETEEQETIREARDYAERMESELSNKGLATRLIVEDVRPNRLADHILAHAQAESVDLIVIGGHHAHNIRESVFGDIGKALAHQAVCPVLLMPSAPH